MGLHVEIKLEEKFCEEMMDKIMPPSLLRFQLQKSAALVFSIETGRSDLMERACCSTVSPVHGQLQYALNVIAVGTS